MAFPIRSKRGFYILTPFLGVIFFLIVISLAALVNNENEQSLKMARTSDINDDLIFSIESVQADVFDVHLHNRLQTILSTIDLEEIFQNSDLTFPELIRNIARDTITEIGKVYIPALRDHFKIDCEVTTAIHSATYILFTEYPGSKIFNIDMTTEIKPIVSRYGLACKSHDPPGSVQLDFQSRAYYLDAENICHQRPNACWPSVSPPPPAGGATDF